jgi:hypothetical protein
MNPQESIAAKANFKGQLRQFVQHATARMQQFSRQSKRDFCSVPPFNSP